MAVVCGACGSPIGETAKFCAECGAKLLGESTDDVRKTVTSPFCDLVGSTSLGERTDPESLRALMERYFAAMRAPSSATGDGGEVHRRRRGRLFRRARDTGG